MPRGAALRGPYPMPEPERRFPPRGPSRILTHKSHRFVIDVIREPSRRLRTALWGRPNNAIDAVRRPSGLYWTATVFDDVMFLIVVGCAASRTCRRRGCGWYLMLRPRFALCWRSPSRRAAATSLHHARLRTRSSAARRRHSRCAGRNCRTRAAADFVRLTDVARPQTMFGCRLEGWKGSMRVRAL